MSGKLLIADDVATNRILLVSRLEAACYATMQAASGAEALRLAARSAPALILLDPELPDIDGVAMLERLAADPQTRDIPVVAMTARDDAATRLALLSAGAAEVLRKPIDDQLLMARLRSLMRARDAEAELRLRGSTCRELGFAEPEEPFAAPATIGLVAPDAATARRWQAELAPHLPARLLPLDRAGALGARPARPAGTERDGTADAPDDGRPRGGGSAPAAGRADTVAADGFADPAAPFLSASGTGARAGHRPTPPDTAPPDPDGARADPDAFVIAADLAGTGDGLRLMSELRSRAGTRHSAVLILLSGGGAGGAMALDLGAAEVMLPPFAPQEMALRLRNMVRRKRLGDQLRASVHAGLRLAVADPLTGLYNRRYALPHLAGIAERARVEARPFAVMALDIDRFKRVNDRHGHAAGDRVLVEVAQRLRDNLRAGDLVARVGGEEFLVAMPDVDLATAHRTAERLRRAIEERPITLPGGDPLSITLSIGLAIGGTEAAHPRAGPLPDPGAASTQGPSPEALPAARCVAAPAARDPSAAAATSPAEPQLWLDALLGDADMALLRSKAEGRNQVTIARPAA